MPEKLLLIQLMEDTKLHCIHLYCKKTKPDHLRSFAHCCGAKYLEILFLLKKVSFGKPRLTHICETPHSWTPLPVSLGTFHSRTSCSDAHLCKCWHRSCNLDFFLPLINSKLVVAKYYSIFLIFNWLISACFIKSAAFVKDLHYFFLIFNWLISACFIKSAAFVKDLHSSTLFCTTKRS